MPSSNNNKSIEDIDWIRFLYEDECEEHHANISLQECLENLSIERAERKRNEMIVEIALMVGALIVFGFLVYSLLRLKKRIGPKFKKSFFAIISGWGIWCFAVFSYSYLFETGLVDDEALFVGWLIFPPILVLAALWWTSKFANRQ